MKKIAIPVLSLFLLTALVACTDTGNGDVTSSIETVGEISTEEVIQSTDDVTEYLTEDITEYQTEESTDAPIEGVTTKEDATVEETTVIDGTTVKLTFNLVPAPQEIKQGRGYTTVSPTVGGDTFENAQKTLCEYSKRIHGTELSVVDSDYAIAFEQVEGLNKEAYTLKVWGGKITVSATDEVGAQNAIATIIQMAEATEGGLKIGECTVTDEPDCEFRAVMVDLARAWHEPHYIYEYIDMCRFFKIRYLQLHFTDSQSWTIPSKEFPNLPTPGRSYTEEDIKSFIEYANLRGVSLIPEIEAPGHSTVLQAEYPRIFGTDGIVCQSERSLSAMETIFAECCELFEGAEYIHMGGDEAAIDLWLGCDKCIETYTKQYPNFRKITANNKLAIMYAGFISRMADVIFDHGMKPIVWEGFPEEANQYISKDILVYSWENYYQTTPSLLEAGFNIVNASWIPMYIVTPSTHWTPKEVYEWNIYTWRAIHPDSPYKNTPLVIEPTDQVKGGMLLAWGDQLSTQKDPDPGIKEEQRLIEERIPFLSYNTWNLDIAHPSYNVFYQSTISPIQALYQKLCETRTDISVSE